MPRNTGLKGRTALFELLVSDNELRETILGGADASGIRAAAERDGNFRPLRQDAVNKVLQGIIGLEEAVTAMKS